MSAISWPIRTRTRKYVLTGLFIGLAIPFLLFYTDGVRGLLEPATWWFFWPSALLGLSPVIREHLVLGVVLAFGGNGLLHSAAAGILRRGYFALIASLLIAAWVISPSSDAKLKKEFTHHRAELEELVQMANQDSKITELTRSFVTTVDGSSSHEAMLSSQRWDQYRQALNQAEVNGFLKSTNGETFIVASRFDAPDRIRRFLGQPSRSTSYNSFADIMGMYAGYVYCPPPPRPLNGDKDFDSWGRSGYLVCSEQHPESNTRSYHYNRLDDNWYLFEVFRKYGY